MAAALRKSPGVGGQGANMDKIRRSPRTPGWRVDVWWLLGNRCHLWIEPPQCNWGAPVGCRQNTVAHRDCVYHSTWGQWFGGRKSFGAFWRTSGPLKCRTAWIATLAPKKPPGWWKRASGTGLMFGPICSMCFPSWPTSPHTASTN